MMKSYGGETQGFESSRAVVVNRVVLNEMDTFLKNLFRHAQRLSLP